ncbi:MAG: virulence factor, partial [Candidatus Limnocylindrales bacterium]
MSATLAVIWWRDIPAQVVAREGRRTHKVVLDTRFQEAIDRAAVRAGLTATDAYL